jgi:hypothetical protein
MDASWDPDRRAASVAAKQDGAIAHHQALACGLSPRQVEGRVASGRWLRATRGVFVVAGAPDTWRQRAQVARLWSGDDGRLTHLTCAAAYRLVTPSPLPHLTIPRGRSTRGGVAVVHRGHIAPIDRAAVDGLPVTTVSRLLVDLAGFLDGPTFDGILDDALCRQLASPKSVLAAAERVGGGRKGLAYLRRSLEVWNEAILPGSVAEMRLVRVLGELGLHRPALQYDVFDLRGDFVARLDAAFPARRRGLEYDGLVTHGPRAWGRDEPRYNRLRALGWEVESVTKLDLLPGERRLRDLAARWGAAAA